MENLRGYLESKGVETGWKFDNLLLLAPTGSKAYGTDTEDSDTDYFGVTVPPIEYYMGLNSFETYNKKNGKNVLNTKEDVDVTLFSLNKFVKNCAEGEPQALELMYLEEGQYLVVTELGKELLRNREMFLSKKVIKKYGMFALHCRKRMEKGRKDYVEKYGYDTKQFQHSVRLYEMLFEILKEGKFTTKRKNAGYLKELRKGKYTLEQAVKLLEGYEEELQVLKEESPLREKCDYSKVDKFLVDLNKRALGM